MRKIEINYTNEYGEKFNINKEVHNDFQDMTEIEFLHNSYKAFLNNFGYPVDCDEQIVVLGENEYIETYCDEDDYCDGDCENCYIDD